MRQLAGVGARDHVALTFDDGPDPTSTPRFLSLLAEHGVRATFFMLGMMAVEARELVGEIAAAGHEVAVHGWEHRMLLKRPPRATVDDITRAHDLLAELTGAAPRWYRPPNGVLTGGALLAARRLGMTPVLWTAWGCDWTNRATATSIRTHVERQLRGGGTVLLHDSDRTSAPGSWHATLASVPPLLDRIGELGLRAGPLREHGLAA
ncbi:MAG: polysaccharide deacetylase family protein [Streptosporangiales bacterium]|nr:polysaccharide deacetylase family protein [Streptosporangiales bacterium]